MPDLLDNGEANPKDIFSVSRLNFEARALLELSFPRIWIEGEISNLAKPKSGHLYFSLKDAKSQVRCTMFRSQNLKLGFAPKNGQQVLINATVGLYEVRGEFQLNVLKMQEYGAGLLQHKFDELKSKLQKQGWFADELKKPLPAIPETIGVISSGFGAAIHDILTTLRLRFPSIPVIIYPTAVQGMESAQEITSAIKIANQRAECDVLIVGRGGGSLEDLWAFNELQVATAIYESELPIVSAVGHESDITIADLVADKRAATPTAAAQLLSPDQTIYFSSIKKLNRQLLLQTKQLLQLKNTKLEHLKGKLRSPLLVLSQFAQRTDELEARLNTNIKHRLKFLFTNLAGLGIRLKLNHPARQLEQNQKRLAFLHSRLHKNFKQTLKYIDLRLQALDKNLNAVNPLNVLARGYAIVKNQDGTIIKSGAAVRKNTKINVRLHDGELEAKVIKNLIPRQPIK